MHGDIVLGANTYCWSHAGMDVETALSQIASLGIRQVDFLGRDHGDPRSMSIERKAKLAAMCRELDLSVSSLLALYDGNLASGDPKEVDQIMAYLVECLDFCQELGSRQICYKPGDRVIGLSKKTTWQNSVARSRELSREAQKRDILITFELTPWPFTMVKDCADMRRMLDDVAADNVFANLDLGHLALVRDGADDVASVAERTIHFHLNDNDTYVHTNDAPGSGRAPLARYLDAVLQHGGLETCRRLGVELVAGIEIEEPPGGAAGMSPLELNRRSRDYSLEHLPQIRL